MATEVLTTFNPFTFPNPSIDDAEAPLVEDGNEFSRLLNGPLVDENLHWGGEAEHPQTADAPQPPHVLIEIPSDTYGENFVHIVDSPPPFLPFSFVEDISSGTKDRLPDLDDAPSNADATLSFGTAPVVPNADVPIRPYADLMPINRPQLPGTPDANPDQNHRKSSYPLLEKALGGTPNHPLQAGQISPPHANKTSAEILTRSA